MLVVPGKKGNQNLKSEDNQHRNKNEDITPERASVTDWRAGQANQDRDLERAANRGQVSDRLKNIVEIIHKEYKEI